MVFARGFVDVGGVSFDARPEGAAVRQFDLDFGQWAFAKRPVLQGLYHGVYDAMLVWRAETEDSISWRGEESGTRRAVLGISSLILSRELTMMIEDREHVGNIGLRMTHCGQKAKKVSVLGEGAVWYRESCERKGI